MCEDFFMSHRDEPAAVKPLKVVKTTKRYYKNIVAACSRADCRPREHSDRPPVGVTVLYKSK